MIVTFNKLNHRALFFFFFNDTAPPEIYPLPLHDALPIYPGPRVRRPLALVALLLCVVGGCRAPALPEAQLFPAGTQFTARYLPVDGTRIRYLRSEEHTSELQSQSNLVCRLLLDKKKYPIR